MPEDRPPRVLGGLHTVFWDYCSRGEFRLQRCANCGRYLWPPAPTCDTCLSLDMSWTEITGNGTLVSHCTFERAWYPECPVPWVVILLRLDEGPLFVSNPRGRSNVGLRGGMQMEAELIACRDAYGEFRLPVFAPADPTEPRSA